MFSVEEHARRKSSLSPLLDTGADASPDETREGNRLGRRRGKMPTSSNHHTSREPDEPNDDLSPDKYLSPGGRSRAQHHPVQEMGHRQISGGILGEVGSQHLTQPRRTAEQQKKLKPLRGDARLESSASVPPPRFGASFSPPNTEERAASKRNKVLTSGPRPRNDLGKAASQIPVKKSNGQFAGGPPTATYARRAEDESSSRKRKYSDVELDGPASSEGETFAIKHRSVSSSKPNVTRLHRPPRASYGNDHPSNRSTLLKSDRPKSDIEKIRRNHLDAIEGTQPTLRVQRPRRPSVIEVPAPINSVKTFKAPPIEHASKYSDHADSSDELAGPDNFKSPPASPQRQTLGQATKQPRAHGSTAHTKAEASLIRVNEVVSNGYLFKLPEMHLIPVKNRMSLYHRGVPLPVQISATKIMHLYVSRQQLTVEVIFDDTGEAADAGDVSESKCFITFCSPEDLASFIRQIRKKLSEEPEKASHNMIAKDRDKYEKRFGVKPYSLNSDNAKGPVVRAAEDLVTPDQLTSELRKPHLKDRLQRKGDNTAHHSAARLYPTDESEAPTKSSKRANALFNNKNTHLSPLYNARASTGQSLAAQMDEAPSGLLEERRQSPPRLQYQARRSERVGQQSNLELLHSLGDPEFPDLVPDDMKYSKIHGLGEPWRRDIIYPPTGKNRTNIEFSDLERLDEGEFLNDNIMNFYFRFLPNERPASQARIYCFNTHFFTSLTQGKPGTKGLNYEGVKRWTRDVDLFQHDFVVVPINENLHWYLAIICNLPNIVPQAQDSQDRQDPLVEAREDVEDADAEVLLVGEAHKGQPTVRQAADDVITEQSPVFHSRDDEPIIDGTVESQLAREANGIDAAALSNRDRGREIYVGGDSTMDVILDSQQDQSIEMMDEQKVPQAGVQPRFDDGEQASDKLLDGQQKSALPEEMTGPNDGGGQPTSNSSKFKKKLVPKGRRVDPYEPAIIILDSLASNTHPNTVRALKEYIAMEAGSKRDILVDPRTIKGLNARPIPAQNNYCDCGLYVLLYLEHFLQDPFKFATALLTRNSEDISWQGFNASELRHKIRQNLQDLHNQQEEDRKKQKAERKSASMRSLLSSEDPVPQDTMEGESVDHVARQNEPLVGAAATSALQEELQRTDSPARRLSQADALRSAVPLDDRESDFDLNIQLDGNRDSRIGSVTPEANDESPAVERGGVVGVDDRGNVRQKSIITVQVPEHRKTSPIDEIQSPTQGNSRIEVPRSPTVVKSSYFTSPPGHGGSVLSEHDERPATRGKMPPKLSGGNTYSKKNSRRSRMSNRPLADPEYIVLHDSD